MSPYLHPRRVDQVTTSLPDILRRHGASILDDWIPGPGLNYTHGLTGVDQEGNFLWVNVLAVCFLIALIGTLALRLFGMATRHFRHMSAMASPRHQAYWAVNHTTWWPWMNRHIFAAPLWKKRHNRGFQFSGAIDNGTLPGRWHTIILVLYCASNIAYCLILPYGTPNVAASLRGRSGTLAALNLIPTILFALRNNPLIPLLQVSYDDFNLFHRWTARITILEAFVHTLAWAGKVLTDGSWKDVAKALQVEESYTWGMVGTVCFLFIGIQAWSPLRHAFYETFLCIHRFVVMFALIGVYVHLDKHSLPQLPWVQIVGVLWGLEWFIRAFRIAWFGISLKERSKITVEALPGEACRVTVDLVRPWRPRPGCNAHVYMPAISYWSSHPFSIAWATEDMPQSQEMKLPISEIDAIAPCAPPTSKQVSFICRARTGFTRQIYEKAAQCEDLAFTTTGFIEGPYGGHHSLDSYGTVLLFAGGVGITHQVMYLKHLIRGAHDGSTCTQKINLIWVIPESDDLEWVRPWMDEILRMKGRKKVLKVELYITRPKRRIDNKTTSVVMRPGRPPTRMIIDEAIRERQGALAIVCCGSGGFADGVRHEARSRIQDGAIDFIEEAFTY
ncbi:hypothetical protein EJ04DRAFT_131055 [Polyplosphaeria fusca]|uniref:FAD-binding FR-type domain-containing protein n=1 Tax=Polyplosphaeria fusca TaxID=682080 RepID=A0A9P4R5K1_9PLEO|nr:hypothetical protein EJ04DRAFT_131055 [Polyplosphaeria fusca]